MNDDSSYEAKEYLTFTLDGEVYALHIGTVLELIDHFPEQIDSALACTNTNYRGEMKC